MGAETLLLAAAVASAAAKGIQGISAYQQASAQATAMRRQGDQAAADAGSQSQVVLEKAARVTGQGVVASAASGGGGGGSALAVLQDLGRQSMYEARRVATEGVAAKTGLYDQARAVKRQGNVALVSSLLQAGSSLLSAGMEGQEAGAQRAAVRTQGQRQSLSRQPSGFSLEGLY